MTCEDCLYYKFCSNQYGDINYFDVENYCGVFEDKSKYIKLPCKVEDTGYYIDYCFYTKQQKIYEGKISELQQKADKSWTFRLSKKYGVVKDYPIDSLGKIVFLTIKEAEQKLKELRKDESNNRE